MSAAEPRRIFLQVTERCEADCPHCGFDCRADGPGLMSVARAEAFLTDLDRRRIRATHLALTGGEPMLYPERTGALARLARARGLVVRVVTGGAWIRSRVQALQEIQALAEAGVSGLWLSAGALTAGANDDNPRRVRWLLDGALPLGLSVFLNFVYFLPRPRAMRGRGVPAVGDAAPADRKTRLAHQAWARELCDRPLTAHGWARIWDTGRARALIDALGPAPARRVRRALARARQGDGALDRDLLGLSWDGREFKPHPDYLS